MKQVGPVRANNAIKIYELFESKSEVIKSAALIEYGYPAQTLDEEIRIFRGYGSKVPQEELGMLESAVAHALALLKAMNAITVLLVANKRRPSYYLLNYKPTLESIQEFVEKSFIVERRTNPTVYDQLINDIATLRDRLDQVERRLKELEGPTNDRNNVRAS